MKRKQLVLCMLLLMLSMGCNKEREEMISESNQPEVTQPVTGLEEDGIQIYTIDMDSMQSISETVYFMDGEEINAENILKEVIELFKVNSIEIELDGIRQKKDTMYISFAKDSAPIVDVSQNVEEIILESIAKSVLDNLEDVEKIVFQVDSGAYKSENLEFEEDEVYLWK